MAVGFVLSSRNSYKVLSAVDCGVRNATCLNVDTSDGSVSHSGTCAALLFSLERPNKPKRARCDLSDRKWLIVPSNCDPKG